MVKNKARSGNLKQTHFYFWPYFLIKQLQIQFNRNKEYFSTNFWKSVNWRRGGKNDELLDFSIHKNMFDGEKSGLPNSE